MGSHRAQVKISFDVHSKHYECDMSINWFLNDYDDIDSRVIDFFRNSYEDSLSTYYEQCADADVRALKRTEQLELQRLKAKYETP